MSADAALSLLSARRCTFLVAAGVLASCGGSPGAPHSGGSGGMGGAGGAGSVVPAGITVSADQRTPRASSWSLGYWTWSPSYGAPVVGTEAQIRALAPPFIRIAGYNNDANVPDPFDHAELDKAVAYASAVGAQLMLQIPLIATGAGVRPTAADAAEMVSYANVTKGYGIKYVSIGNEPDLYPDQGGISAPEKPALPGYTPAQYCTEARAFVAAVKAVDPTIQVVGPELGYKYQAGVDWLTPILEDCHALFDVVAIHRYPYESKAVTVADAARDRAALTAVIGDVRWRMGLAAAGDKPLAVTEANLAYIGSPTGNPGGSLLGTVPHALWVVDFLGTAAELGLWSAGIYDISDGDAFKLGVVGVPPAHAPRPAYHALALYGAHAGPTTLAATTTDDSLRAYASRDAGDTTTHVVATNWSDSALALSLTVTGPTPAKRIVTAVVPGLSVSAFELPDGAPPHGWTYGDAQLAKAVGPEVIAVSVIVE